MSVEHKMVDRKIIQVNGVKPATSKAGKKKRTGVALGLAALVLIVVGVLYFATRSDVMEISGYSIGTVEVGQMTLSTEASGSVVLPRQVVLVSPQEGYAAEIFVEEGQTVTTDDILAVLDVPDLEDDEWDLVANLTNAEITLEELEVTYRYKLENLETEIVRKTALLAEAEEDLEVAQRLSSLNSSRESDYEAALEARDTALENLEDVRADLAEQSEMETIVIKKQKAQINLIATSLERTREDLEDMQIKSPIAGEVLSINEDLSVGGSLILKQAELFQVADTSAAYLDLEVYEQYADDLALGGLITVTVGSTILEAEIVKIGQVASLSSDGLAATISVRAQPVGEVDLTVGASAVAVLPLGVKTGTLLLPRGSYLTTGSQKYLYVVEGDEAVKTKVTFGSIQGTQVEVLDGVDPGAEVILSGYQNFIDQERVVLK